MDYTNPNFIQANAVVDYPTINTIPWLNPRQLLSQISDDDYFAMMPPGYRFCPTEVELISTYLMNKIHGKALPRNKIHDVNLYEYSPNELIEHFVATEANQWYFFTPRDKKYAGGRRPSRAAGGGFWKATGADRPITHMKEVIGWRKALVYYKGKPNESTKTDWMMHEYRAENAPPPAASSSSSDSMRLDDCILCKIYKREPRPPRKVKSDEEENPQEPVGDDDAAVDLDPDDLILEPLNSGWNPSHLAIDEMLLPP